jgi:hypothetical protein
VFNLSRPPIAVFLVLVLCNSFGLAQRGTRESVKQSSAYYWGEAVAATEKEASDLALARLTQGIVVTVSSDMEYLQVERQGDIQSTLRSIMKTYSTATLKNVKTILTTVENGVEVFHYIEKSEVKRLFDSRVATVGDIFDRAAEMEQAGEIGDALKWYYFAIILMNSVPEAAILHNELNLSTEIPFRINRIINATTLTLSSDRRLSDAERELVFNVSTYDRPVRSLDFTVWDGQTQVTVQAKDGQAVLRLFGASTAFEKLEIALKYSYYESREEIREVADLWGLVSKPTFKNGRQIALNAKPPLLPQTGTVLLADSGGCNVIEKITREVDTFAALLRDREPGALPRQYASDPFLGPKMANIVRYNHPELVDDVVRANIYKTYTGWEVRRIRVHTNYPSLKKQALEYFVLDFTPDGRLEDVNFGIMDGLHNLFVQQGIFGNDWGNRQVIIKFTERYRTALLGRNIAMIDSMFADEAVIIVGRVFKKTHMPDAYQYARLADEQPDFTTIRYTKEQYLKHQKNSFAAQKDIFVGYSTFKIHRKNKKGQEGVYGISMRQSYNSTTYSDEGYLFLLVDFNEKYPQIYVRSWQPQEWNEESLVRLSNFNINR